MVTGADVNSAQNPPVGTIVSANATCSTGSVASGGYFLIGSPGPLQVVVTQNSVIGSNQWNVTAENRVAGSNSQFFGIRVIIQCTP
jgi:hypothetical protein